MMSFNDLILFQNIALLSRAYKNVDDIDLFIGMSMEEPLRQDGDILGSTFLCLIGDQFARLKKGDRYFHDLFGQPGSFNIEQLTQIRKASLARVLCDNTNLDEIQPLVFRPSNQR